jgi:hypothetical protein
MKMLHVRLIRTKEHWVAQIVPTGHEIYFGKKKPAERTLAGKIKSTLSLSSAPKLLFIEERAATTEAPPGFTGGWETIPAEGRRKAKTIWEPWKHSSKLFK